jgi:hypothetical protein
MALGHPANSPADSTATWQTRTSDGDSRVGFQPCGIPRPLDWLGEPAFSTDLPSRDVLCQRRESPSSPHHHLRPPSAAAILADMAVWRIDEFGLRRKELPDGSHCGGDRSLCPAVVGSDRRGFGPNEPCDGSRSSVLEPGDFAGGPAGCSNRQTEACTRNDGRGVHRISAAYHPSHDPAPSRDVPGNARAFKAKFQFKANIQNARCRVCADEEAPRNESQCALSVREWAQIQAVLRRRTLISQPIARAASGCER